MDDWKQEIATAVLVNQAVMEADKNNIWPHHFPRVAATEAEIRKTEERLGHELAPKYREFLKYANGWPSFYQAVDLFGTEELAGGPMMEYARELLDATEDDALEASGFSRDELLPIAATPTDRDLFLLVRPPHPAAGTVLWFAGEEVERFPGFDEFFLSMVDYNRLNVQTLNEQSATGGSGAVN